MRRWGSHTGLRTRCSYQNSWELWAAEDQRGWGEGAIPRKCRGRIGCREEPSNEQGHLCIGGDWEFCACLRVFKKLTLPWNHEIPWCLRHPDSLPNWSLEEVTRPDRMGALKGASEWSCPTARQALDEGAFSATQVLTRNQAPKRKKQPLFWLELRWGARVQSLLSVPLHFPPRLVCSTPRSAWLWRASLKTSESLNTLFSGEQA